jgi:hypothetical protein
MTDYYRAGPPPPLSAHRTLEDRVQGEAEARSDLAGQFHEALADLITFTQEAHEAVMLNEANITALQSIQARLIDAFDEYIVYSTKRMDALSTAVEAVWNVTKPRPSRWQRFQDWVADGREGDLSDPGAYS